MAEQKEPQFASFAEAPGATIPATFSNRFFVFVGPETTRIVFAEGLGGETINLHTAIVMPTGDAEALGRALTETIDKNRGVQTAANITEEDDTVRATGEVGSDGK